MNGARVSEKVQKRAASILGVGALLLLVSLRLPWLALVLGAPLFAAGTLGLLGQPSLSLAAWSVNALRPSRAVSVVAGLVDLTLGAAMCAIGIGLLLGQLEERRRQDTAQARENQRVADDARSQQELRNGAPEALAAIDPLFEMANGQIDAGDLPALRVTLSEIDSRLVPLEQLLQTAAVRARSARRRALQDSFLGLEAAERADRATKNKENPRAGEPPGRQTGPLARVDGEPPIEKPTIVERVSGGTPSELPPRSSVGQPQSRVGGREEARILRKAIRDLERLGRAMGPLRTSPGNSGLGTCGRLMRERQPLARELRQEAETIKGNAGLFLGAAAISLELCVSCLEDAEEHCDMVRSSLNEVGN